MRLLTNWLGRTELLASARRRAEQSVWLHAFGKNSDDSLKLAETNFLLSSRRIVFHRAHAATNPARMESSATDDIIDFLRMVLANASQFVKEVERQAVEAGLLGEASR